jgi:hypothetical protein
MYLGNGNSSKFRTLKNYWRKAILTGISGVIMSPVELKMQPTKHS